MSEQNGNQVPDLATVLRNLASLQPQQAQLSAPSQTTLQYPSQHAAPSSTKPPIPSGYNISQAVPQQQPLDPRLVPQHHRSSPATPTIDPATIIEWSQGLRCVTKISSQNPNFKPVVQRMIADQQQHELMWWGGRQALMGQRPTKEELQAYDMKIHRASREMVAAMSAQLKSLGVPFFGMKPELVVLEQQKETAGAVPPKGKITEEQMLKLQRKMLEYLEDMYKEE